MLDFELHQLSQDSAEFFKEVAAERAGAIREEITTFESQAESLSEEIKSLTGLDVAPGQ